MNQQKTAAAAFSLKWLESELYETRNKFPDCYIMLYKYMYLWTQKQSDEKMKFPKDC